MEKLIKRMELCKGRHEIPAASDGAIFETTLDPLAVDYMESVARQKVKGLDELILYVTGLSVALVSVINACKLEDVKLTLQHYDRDSGLYYSQEVK